MKKHLLICLSSLFFIGCASISSTTYNSTTYVDELLDRGNFAELYYYIVNANNKNIDEAKFKSAILEKTGGAKNSSFFNLAAKQINNAYYPSVNFFIEAHKFIQEARKDSLVTEEQAIELDATLKENFEKKFFNTAELTNFTEIVKLWPDIKIKSDEIFQEKLRHLMLETDSSVESFFPIYIYFKNSNNTIGKTQALTAMQVHVKKNISASKNLSDLEPVFKYIQVTGDRSLDAKIISSIENMNLKKSEINSSVKELFPDFYKKYISQIKSNKNSLNESTSSILIEACNGIKEDAKRLRCLQEIMLSKSQNFAQPDNGVQDLKKAFASISGAVNSGINFQKYQAIALGMS